MTFGIIYLEKVTIGYAYALPRLDFGFLSYSVHEGPSFALQLVSQIQDRRRYKRNRDGTHG